MLRAFGHAVAMCWMLLTQIWPRLNLSYQHASFRNNPIALQQGSQTLATFSIVLSPTILRYAGLKCWD